MNKDLKTSTIGKYHIVGRIGFGGFGTVFEAWDPVIKRAVAIKVCDARRDLHARFLQEAELAGRLHHPNITAVYECGVEGKTPFIVQEFLGGEDLSAMVARREPTDLGDRIKILAGVAVGLDYAHRSGVVHRDIKPANIRVLENGSIKIMDFGIAKAMDAPSVVTGTGITVGSSSYMAPEQVCGDPIDPRTDIFSFGVLAYELLSYRKAFDSDNLFRTLEMIVKEEPEPLALAAPWLPQALCDVVARTMCKRPDDRFGSMKELLASLVAVNLAPDEAAPRAAPSAPATDRRRLALEAYAILDTAPEPEFDDLARLAARICDTPIAFISLLDRQRLWLKSAVGVRVRELPVESAFCARTARSRGILVVEDASAEAAFASNPLVRQEPSVRFYAGAPLVTPEGSVLGALCVLDTRPRTLSADGREALRVLAAQVMAQLELRRRRRDSDGAGEKLLLEATGLSEPARPRTGESHE